MGRRQRIDPVGGIHHVMNRGVDRQPIFFGDADRVEFGRRLAELYDRFGVETLAYCLMPNHYHLLIRLPRAGLVAAMHHLGSVYTRHTNDRVGRDGPLFRGRYHAINVTTDEYLLWVVRYIHRNPLSLADVGSASEYRWSSYRAYSGHRWPAPFLNTAFVLDYFGGDPKRWAVFVDEPTQRDPVSSGMLGSLVEFAIAHDDLTHGSDDRSTPQWLDRTIRVLLLDHPLDADLRAAIETELGLPTGRARRMVESRARARLVSDPAVRRILTTVTAALGSRSQPGTLRDAG